MSRRADQIRKQLKKRRKQRGFDPENKIRQHEINISDAESPVFESDPPDSVHPLWNKEIFLFKVLCSAVLVLITAITFQSSSPKVERIQESVKSTMENEFQFTAVAQWYEDKFGQPLAFLPSVDKENQNNVDEQNPTFAQPVSGKILEHFSDENQGIIMETGSKAEVEAMADGMVVFAGKKEGIGNTVIIQHSDQSESWYGKLEQITVKPYEKVKIGTKLGIVSTDQERLTGEFYFAIKRENTFIDPIQVMKLE